MVFRPHFYSNLWFTVMKPHSVLYTQPIDYCLTFFVFLDTVYIESQRPDMPYYICSIRDFKRVSFFYYSLYIYDKNADSKICGHFKCVNYVILTKNDCLEIGSNNDLTY